MKQSNSKERLKEMMDIFGLRQADIVKRTGVQKSSLSNYVSGRRTPTQEQLSKIADPYGVNPAWLMGYDVPMSTLPTKQERQTEELRAAYEYRLFYDSMSDEDKEQVADIEKKLVRLTPENRTLILNLLKSLLPDS